MRWSLCTFLLIQAFLVNTWAIAGHNVLLPQPQQLHYGPRELRIRGLGIRLVGDPGIEDRFAAERLSSKDKEKS